MISPMDYHFPAADTQEMRIVLNDINRHEQMLMMCSLRNQ